MAIGRCLCGAVAWQAEGPLELMHHGHCTFCRKAHGAAFATYVVAPEAGFRFTAGRESVVRYASTPGVERAFCGRCGSVLPGPVAEGRAMLPAGGLDGDPGVRPLAPILVGSKVPWYEIADALPRDEGAPESAP